MVETFDPRFEARYQPGFQETTGDVNADVSMSEGATSTTSISSPPASAQSAFGSEDTEAEQNVELGPEPNPFERTLLIVGAGLILGGIAAAWWANSINFARSAIGSPWTWQELLQTAGWNLSAPMVTVGLAIGVGILFRRAITWKPPE